MKIKAAIDLLRIPNLLITAATILITYVFTIRTIPLDQPIDHLLNLGPATIIVLAIMAAGNVINDIFDYKIDQINRPTKIIVGKSISIKNTRLLYISLNFLALTIALILFLNSGNLLLFLIFLSAIILLYIYSAFLKRRPVWGNFIVAILCTTVLWIIPLSFDIGALKKWSMEFLPITMFSVFAFCTTLVREIIKDLEDIKGDQIMGGRTIATEWPLKKTKIIAFFFLTPNLIGLSYLTFFLVANNELPIGIYSGILILSSFYLLYKLRQMEKLLDYVQLSRNIKLYMLQGLILLALWN